MINIDLLFNEDFLKKIQDIELTEYEKDAIYMYLSLFNEELTDEEKSMWYDILNAKKNNIDDKKDTDTNT